MNDRNEFEFDIKSFLFRRPPNAVIEIDGGFECTNCKIFVDESFKLKNHLCVYDSKVSTQVQADDLRCGGCGDAFQVKNLLLDHLSNCDSGKDQTFPCMKCNLVFYDYDSAIFHNMWRHEQKFRCEYCDKSFEKPEVYLKHWTMVHSRVKDQHKCPDCDRTFDYRKNLENHMKVHEETRQKTIGYSCDKCDRTFKAR